MDKTIWNVTIHYKNLSRKLRIFNGVYSITESPTFYSVSYTNKENKKVTVSIALDGIEEIVVQEQPSI